MVPADISFLQQLVAGSCGIINLTTPEESDVHMSKSLKLPGLLRDQDPNGQRAIPKKHH